MIATKIGPLAVRRSIYIKATPERIWQEFESLERMRAWFGTGHKLVKYEPRVGAEVETDASGVHDEHPGQLRFVGRVTVYDPPRELTFEQDWVGRGWTAAALITIRLTPALAGTVVELFHHNFENMGADPGELLRGFEGGWTTRQMEALLAVVEG